MSIVVITAATTAATSAAVAANNAAAAARKKAQCDAVMADYQHNTATLEMQQTYAACVPRPATGDPMFDPKVVVALLLLAVPIAAVVAWRARHEDGWVTAVLVGMLSGISWIVMLFLAGLIFAGVLFLFA